MTSAAKKKNKQGGDYMRKKHISWKNNLWGWFFIAPACMGPVSYTHLSYLSHMFKQQTGGNLSAYIEEIRIKEALKLFRTQKLSIGRCV